MTDLGRVDTDVITSEVETVELTTAGVAAEWPVSAEEVVAADDDVAAVTVMLTRESTGAEAPPELVVATLVVLALNVASSWRAFVSSYAHVSSASSTTARLLSGNSSISRFRTGKKPRLLLLLRIFIYHKIAKCCKCAAVTATR